MTQKPAKDEQSGIFSIDLEEKSGDVPGVTQLLRIKTPIQSTFKPEALSLNDLGVHATHEFSLMGTEWVFQNSQAQKNSLDPWQNEILKNLKFDKKSLNLSLKFTEFGSTHVALHEIFATHGAAFLQFSIVNPNRLVISCSATLLSPRSDQLLAILLESKPSEAKPLEVNANDESISIELDRAA